VKEELSIGSNTIIGMGAVVSREIGDNVIAVGDPARAVRRNEDGIVFREHS
jgi:acyl-[acyl-carrier-protein]--udp-n-acetylglucosamine o-acyltransferas (udp-n-acetylglucosamine acyltransferase) (2.3.1.129)